MATRITGARKPRGAGAGGNGRSLNTTDNQPTAEQIAADRKAREEAEGVQLLSVVSQIKRQMPKVEAKRAELKVEQDALNDIFRSAKAANKNFERGVLMDLVNDSNAGSRRDVTAAEERRARFREVMGLPVSTSGMQQELDARLPDVERDGLYWLGVGYTDGVTGVAFHPPAECVGAGHDNRYREGYEGGQAKLGMALGKKPPAAAPVDPNDDLSDPSSPASLRKLAKDMAAAKAALGKMTPLPESDAEADHKAGEMAAGVIHEPGTNGLPPESADDFEATPEELAGQTARVAIRDAEPSTDEAVG